MIDAGAEDRILELLANGPSSFAAIYGFLARQDIGMRPSVGEVIGVATDLERNGWIRVCRLTPEGRYDEVTDPERVRIEREYRRWLETPTADLSVDALSIDEIGLWFELLPNGLDEWKKRTSSVEETPPFTVDFNATSGVVRIRAVNVDIAKRLLAEWLMRNPRTDAVLRSMVIEDVDTFQLRNGRTMNGGIELRIETSRSGN